MNSYQVLDVNDEVPPNNVIGEVQMECVDDRGIMSFQRRENPPQEMNSKPNIIIVAVDMPGLTGL